MSLYQQTYDLYQKHLHDVSMGAIGDAAATAWYEGVRGKLVEKDAKWMEVTGRETRSSMQRLEVELKGYMTNLIKESIRVSSRSSFQSLSPPFWIFTMLSLLSRIDGTS